MLIRALIDLYGTTELLTVKPVRTTDKISEVKKNPSQQQSKTEGRKEQG